MTLADNLYVAFLDRQNERIALYLGKENCSMSSIATLAQIAYGPAIASNAYCALWSDYPPSARVCRGRASPPLPPVPGLEKAREPGNRPHGYPALRFAVRAVEAAELFATRWNLFGGLIVCNTSGNSARPSTETCAFPSENWCRWCGADIPHVGTKSKAYCGLACVEEYHDDARKRRVPEPELNRIRASMSYYRALEGKPAPERSRGYLIDRFGKRILRPVSP